MADHRYPTLGFDPTPGDVHDTRQLARRLGDLAGELGTTATELARIETGAWKGKAATAFADHVSENVTPHMERAHASFDKAARALGRWAGQLEDFQDEARALEREAERKQQALGNAERALETGRSSAYAGDSEGDGGDARERQQDKREDAVGDAGDALDAVRQRAEELRVRYYEAAGAICRDLDSAGDIAPDEPGLFDSIAGGVADMLGDAAGWVQDHADLIKAIGDVLSYVTAALAVLAILTAPFPPIGAAFASAALVYAGLTMLTHGIAKAAGADVSWATLAFDSLGLIPGMGAFGKGIKFAEDAAAIVRVEQLGKTFKFDKIAAGTRNLLARGDVRGTVQGGLNLAIMGKGVTLFGKHTKGFIVFSPGRSLATRVEGVGEAFRQGQVFGTQGLNMLGKSIDPLSVGGRLLDSGIKMAPKALAPVAQHVGEAVDLGDRFALATSR